MSQIIYFLLFALGLAMIIKGSDWFIDAVIWTATVFKIPYIIIGATIVSICTTLPETFVSLTASLKGATDVAFGNALGSIALNAGFVLAILLIFAKPVIEDKPSFLRNGLFLIFLMIFTWSAGLIFGQTTRAIGVFLVILLAAYILFNFFSAKASMDLDIRYDVEDDSKVNSEPELYEGVSYDAKENDIDISSRVIIKNIVYFTIGITLVIIGSNLLVDNGIKIAEILGVPPIVIAITFTALGTSLPELVTTISSIRKKVTNLGVGNIIGANILNILQVIGISSLITPIPLNRDPSILIFQFPVALLIVSAGVLFGIFSKKGFQRWQGVLILLMYIVFLTVNLLRENSPILGPMIFG